MITDILVALIATQILLLIVDRVLTRLVALRVAREYFECPDEQEMCALMRREPWIYAAYWCWKAAYWWLLFLRLLLRRRHG